MKNIKVIQKGNLKKDSIGMLTLFFSIVIINLKRRLIQISLIINFYIIVQEPNLEFSEKELLHQFIRFLKFLMNFINFVIDLHRKKKLWKRDYLNNT